MTDYERGVEQASAIYKEVIREYVAENAKLRKTVKAAWGCVNSPIGCYECRMVSGSCTLLSAMLELGIEVDA